MAKEAVEVAAVNVLFPVGVDHGKKNHQEKKKNCKYTPPTTDYNATRHVVCAFGDTARRDVKTESCVCVCVCSNNERRQTPCHGHCRAGRPRWCENYMLVAQRPPTSLAPPPTTRTTQKEEKKIRFSFYIVRHLNPLCTSDCCTHRYVLVYIYIIFIRVIIIIIIFVRACVPHREYNNK